MDKWEELKRTVQKQHEWFKEHPGEADAGDNSKDYHLGSKDAYQWVLDFIKYLEK